MLVVGPTGAVRSLNAGARLLLPTARPGAALADTAPAWLAAAHRSAVQPVPSPGPGAPPAPVHGLLGERTVAAHPTPERDGSVVWWLVDETDQRLARTALSTERERTAFLVEASNLLLSSLNVQRCTEATARLAAGHLADAAVLVAPAGARRLPVTTCVRGGDPSGARLAVDPATVPGLPEALQGFPPVPSRWIDPAALPGWAVPDGFGPVGSVVVTPLPGHGVPAGALILLRRSGQAAFSDGEEVFARLFAARAGAALSAARLYAEQSSITDILMRELLPPALHRVNGVELAAAYTPARAGERVGGDFYDVHPADDAGRDSLVVLGDVCGKGLEAAVLTGKIRNTLHALLPLADDHARVLRLLNGTLLSSHHTRFASLVLASVRRSGANVELRLTSAGHPAPLVVRRDGTVESAPTGGTIIGVLPDIRSTTARVVLRPGESCLLFTDGITEARGGPLGDGMFGEERLARALAGCQGMPMEALVEHVLLRASSWLGGGPHDDQALVAIGAPLRPAPGTAALREERHGA
ncbi:PP2C family protein-serine/threonine phosphatase [Kitasatospora sp. NPDC059571]|uniref:PP2C family protein-serine/threonine phosphatase n=1 Tax=Kitasatospora sp. NPDC059571 TaxID=3346871 RepID=UPI00367DD8C7